MQMITGRSKQALNEPSAVTASSDQPLRFEPAPPGWRSTSGRPCPLTSAKYSGCSPNQGKRHEQGTQWVPRVPRRAFPGQIWLWYWGAFDHWGSTQRQPCPDAETNCWSTGAYGREFSRGAAFRACDRRRSTCRDSARSPKCQRAHGAQGDHPEVSRDVDPTSSVQYTSIASVLSWTEVASIGLPWSNNEVHPTDAYVAVSPWNSASSKGLSSPARRLQPLDDRTPSHPSPVDRAHSWASVTTHARQAP